MANQVGSLMGQPQRTTRRKSHLIIEIFVQQVSLATTFSFAALLGMTESPPKKAAEDVEVGALQQSEEKLRVRYGRPPTICGWLVF